MASCTGEIEPSELVTPGRRSDVTIPSLRHDSLQPRVIKEKLPNGWFAFGKAWVHNLKLDKGCPPGSLDVCLVKHQWVLARGCLGYSLCLILIHRQRNAIIKALVRSQSPLHSAFSAVPDCLSLFADAPVRLPSYSEFHGWWSDGDGWGDLIIS